MPRVQPTTYKGLVNYHSGRCGSGGSGGGGGGGCSVPVSLESLPALEP